MLQLKTDLLGSIFGQEKAAALLEQVASSVRDRDLLHNSLLQRKSKLQVSIRVWPHSALECGHGAGTALLGTLIQRHSPSPWLWINAFVTHSFKFYVHRQGKTFT